MNISSDCNAPLLLDMALPPSASIQLASKLRPATEHLIDPQTVPLLPRDQCILAFSVRVLSWAQRHDVPLLERLRYWGIVSASMAEFFEMRAAPHVAVLKDMEDGATPAVPQTLALWQQVQALVAAKYAVYNNGLLTALEAAGIVLLDRQSHKPAQRRWMRQHFLHVIKPLLLPVVLDAAHPLPQVASQSLNLAVRLRAQHGLDKGDAVAIVKLPSTLPGWIQLPKHTNGGRHTYLSLSGMVNLHINELFEAREVLEVTVFRVTRDAALCLDENQASDLRRAVKSALARRPYGTAVRLEVGDGCSAMLRSKLCEGFDLPQAAVWESPMIAKLPPIAALVNDINAPAMLFAPWQGCWPEQLKPGARVMPRMRRQDVLIHQPFERFDAVLQLLREAVHDPAVLSIQQTIYRTDAGAELIDLLKQAVYLGKEVMVVLELKARLDEAANVAWADALEAVGAQVIYGVLGMKTHAKMLLITRREGRRLQRYGHLSTGNYHSQTAQLYTDLSYMTCAPGLTADMHKVFCYLAHPFSRPHLQTMLMAPFNLQSTMLEHLAACAEAARQGQYARVVVKTNALTDEVLIRALMQAAQAGTRIDLLVRGACMLPAQLKGVSDNVHVRSVVGRLLEHSRVFYFAWGEQQEHVYLSSADWMQRNMERRIELAWPVTDPSLRQRVIDECLVAYLHDDRDAWQQRSDGSYSPPACPGQGRSAQEALMQRYRS